MTKILFKTATALALATAMALSACQDRMTGWGTETDITAETDDDNTLSFYTYLPYSYGDATANQVRTRASLNDTTAYGDDTHRENYIDNMDIFIYKSDATAEDKPIYTSMGIHYEQIDSDAHYSIKDGDGNIIEGHNYGDPHKGCLYKIMLRVTDNDKKQIFGDYYSNPVKVALIANRPWSGYKDTEYSVQSLRETVINTYWPSMNWNSYTFPMSGMAEITPTPGTKTDTIINADGTVIYQDMTVLKSISGIIPLRRVAAKVQSYINVVDSAIQKDDEGNEAVYFPVKDQIRVSFYNGATRTMIDSTLSEDTLIKDQCFYDLRNRVTRKDSITHYEEVRDENGNVIEANRAVPYFYTHEQFYTYPRIWTENKSDMTSGVTADYDPRFVVMVPWKLRVAGRSGDEAETYSTPFSTYYQFSANRRTHRFDRNTFYKLYIKITQPGSQTEAVPVDVTPLGYTIQPWGEVTMGNGIGDNVVGEFVSYQYLVVDPLTKVVKNSSSTTFTYSSSSSVTARVIYANFADYSDAGTTNWSEWKETDAAHKDSIEDHYFVTVDESSHTIKVTHDLKNENVSHEIWVEVENDDHLTEVIKIYQYPEIYITTLDGDNVFVNGYFSHVANGGKRGSYNTSGYDFNGNYTYYYKQFDNNSTTVYGSLVTELTSTDGNLTNNRLICVNVTSFDNDNGYYTVDGTKYYYIIGDPRVSGNYTSSDLTDYYGNVDSTWTETTGRGRQQRTETKSTSTWKWDGTAASKIMIGSTTVTGRQLIAPAFLLASAWSSSGPHSFETAQKRAATYQESGHPAGRWRLPTEAEIQFCVYLQNQGLIPTQFGPDACYWASSGRAYYNGSFINEDEVFYTYKQWGQVYKGYNKTCYSRPVYDVWYWGYDTYDDAQYHIRPDKTTEYATQR